MLTYAFGLERYKSQAVALAQSIKIGHPGLALACVTDDVAHEGLSRWFDVLIPYDPRQGKNLKQKLFFDQYTPFQRTIVIDSDCLITGLLDDLIERCKGRSFAVLGTAATYGWWYMDIAKAMAKYKLAFVPRFNGGFYYFVRDNVSDYIFRKARQIGRIHPRMGIYELGDWFNEEVFYAIAMAAAHIEPLGDESFEGMFTPNEFTDPFKINTIDQVTEYVAAGQPHRPRIAHFFGHHVRTFHYIRESVRLKLTFGFRINSVLVGFYIGLLNVLYFVFIKAYQVISYFRGKPVLFKSSMPLIPISSLFTSVSKRFF